jgi:dTDP-4-amino-4,6-dideoxygalactose transaminase
MLRNYGSRTKYRHELAGFNSRLDALQCAFLRAKLPLLDADNARRRTIARRYLDGLRSVSDLLLPVEPARTQAAWHLFVVRHSRRDSLARRLANAGIESMIHYPVPPHLQPAYASLAMPRGTFPVSERLHEQVISLPMGPHLSDMQVDEVIRTVRDV